MIGIAIALVAAAPAAAQPASPAAVAAQARGAAAMKALGMSDAGIKVLRQQSAPDPDARALMAKRQAMRQQLADAASASPLDIDAFSALLRESSLMEGTARTRNEERIIATLKALPVADRTIFAKAVFGGPGGAPPATPPAPRP